MEKSATTFTQWEARKERLPSTHSLLMVPKPLLIPLSWVLRHKLIVEKAPGLLYRTCLMAEEYIPPVKKAPILTVSRVSEESSFTTEAPHSCSILSSSSVEDGCKTISDPHVLPVPTPVFPGANPLRGQLVFVLKDRDPKTSVAPKLICHWYAVACSGHLSPWSHLVDMVSWSPKWNTYKEIQDWISNNSLTSWILCEKHLSFFLDPAF